MNPEALRVIRNMQLNRRFLISTAALAIALPLLGADEPPAAGAPAPEFMLQTQEGKAVSLKDFHGKWVVLYFYPKDMTRGCTIEAHNFQRDLEQYNQKNAVILGVSVDNVESHKEFCAKESLTFKLLADVNKEVSTKYGSLMTMGTNTLSARNTFLIDPKGVIRKVYMKVNPMPHSAEVLAALDELKKSSD